MRRDTFSADLQKSKMVLCFKKQKILPCLMDESWHLSTSYIEFLKHVCGHWTTEQPGSS